METAYIIRSVNTGKMIEAHDALSLEWAQKMVETHNILFPSNQWVMLEETV